MDPISLASWKLSCLFACLLPELLSLGGVYEGQAVQSMGKLTECNRAGKDPSHPAPKIWDEKKRKDR